LDIIDHPRNPLYKYLLSCRAGCL